MAGLATITLSTSVVRAEETTDQSSYPLKSENAIPLGDFSKYLSLSWPCAERAEATMAASSAAVVATMVKPALRSTAVRVSILCSCCSCAADFVRSSDMLCSPSPKSFLSAINLHLERFAIKPDARGVKQLD